MIELKVADWVPNTLHAGFYIAQANGYFKDEGLEVEFISPEEDNYAVTPAKKLSEKQVHLAVTPSESVISYHTLDNPVPLKAIAAILQQDTSAIVTRKDSGIDRPAKLDGKVFTSYNARFEDNIIRQLVKNDGGKGNIIIRNPEKADMWLNVANQSADATWIFMPWEGIQAKFERDISFNAFRLSDYQIPYGYTPLIVSHEDIISEESNAIAAFLHAVEKGFRDVDDDHEKAAEKLHRYIDRPDFSNVDMLKASLLTLKSAMFDDEGGWGYMAGVRWVDFVDWMIQHQVMLDQSGKPITHGQIDTSLLYTNDFFKK